MKILLINPPYQTLTSNLGVGHQVPLGLLMVGGPLIDNGHDVRLLDAECRRLTLPAIINEVKRFNPQVVMTGHAGSTPAHPICLRLLRAVKAACPEVTTVYGGVYPTYRAARILAEEPAVDIIIRGEGEATAAELMETLTEGRGSPHQPLGPRVRCPAERDTFIQHVLGIAYRAGGQIILTPPRPPVINLDSYRVGWELIDRWDDYRCFGLGRAAVVQFSRGCPHQCTYCGQHGFWTKWRHRDPVQFANEIEWLHRTHDIRFFTLADENPTTLPSEWRRFLEIMADRQLPLAFFATIRATDIVRDADLLPLYRKAGILYVLMGIESTSDVVLKKIKKGSTTRHDYQACQLLKRHGIFSIIGHIVGFAEETWGTFRTAFRQLSLYDGDYLNAMYVTPHVWTSFGQEALDHQVVQLDQRKWDYRHQVLAQTHLKPWQLFVGVKCLEWCFHLRPTRLWDLLRERDAFRRRQRLWVHTHIGAVWLAEVVEFLLATSYARWSVTLADLEMESRQPVLVPSALHRRATASTG